MLLALKHGLKFIIFSAENKSGGVFRKLIEFKYCRELKDISENELNEGYKWAKEHFTILANEDSFTYKDILARAAKVLKHKKHDALLIDPYNSLYRETNKHKNTHEYDYDVLGDMRLFATHFDCSIYVNCHVVTEAARRIHPQGHDYEGMLMAPNKSDTEGGGKFANRVDDFWTVHRYTQHATDWNICNIHVRKVRETETGGRPTIFDKPIKLYNMWGVGFETENRINPVVFTPENFNIKPLRKDSTFNDF
jgi:hypothetical protein